MTHRHWARVAAIPLLLALPGCSADELIGAASRTVRNICVNAPNCTAYNEDGEPIRESDPWDTKR